MLSDMPEACQHFLTFFRGFIPTTNPHELKTNVLAVTTKTEPGDEEAKPKNEIVELKGVSSHIGVGELRVDVDIFIEKISELPKDQRERLLDVTTTLGAARALARARFAFSISTAPSSASFRLTRRIEGFDSRLVSGSRWARHSAFKVPQTATLLSELRSRCISRNIWRFPHSRASQRYVVGRGQAVGRGLGVGIGRGVSIAVAVAVGVPVAVVVAVAVAIGVVVGLGVPPPHNPVTVTV